MPNEQFFSYIMTRTCCIFIRWEGAIMVIIEW